MCGLATGAEVTLYATALPATMAVVSGIATPAAEAIADEAIANKNKTKQKKPTHTATLQTKILPTNKEK
jgi:hypothetical protein